MFENINKKIQKNVIFLIVILLLTLMVIQYYKIKNKEDFTGSNGLTVTDITAALNAAATNAKNQANDNATKAETEATKAENTATKAENTAAAQKDAWKKSSLQIAATAARKTATTARETATSVNIDPVSSSDAYNKDFQNHDPNYSLFTKYCNSNSNDENCRVVCNNAITSGSTYTGYTACKNFCIANPTNNNCKTLCASHPENNDCMLVTSFIQNPTIVKYIRIVINGTDCNIDTVSEQIPYVKMNNVSAYDYENNNIALNTAANITITNSQNVFRENGSPLSELLTSKTKQYITNPNVTKHVIAYLEFAFQNVVNLSRISTILYASTTTGQTVDPPFKCYFEVLDINKNILQSFELNTDINMEGKDQFFNLNYIDTTPYKTTPYATTPYATTPYATTPYATTPYKTTPYATTPYATTPYATTPYATTPYATTPMSTFNSTLSFTSLNCNTLC